MPTFLWSGKDAGGLKRHERIDAEDAQAAKAVLVNRGWTDLELVLDELHYSKAVRMESTKEVDADIRAQFNTPEAQASFHKRGWKTSVLGRTLQAVIKSYKLILLSAGLIALGIYRHEWSSLVIGSLGLAFAVFFIPAYHVLIRVFGHVRSEFHRMQRAKTWGRWDEVLECVERLRKPDRMTGSVFPEFELVRSRALALAALGRLNEGLAEYRQFENSPKVEHWLYLTFLATIYDADRQFGKGLELRRQAAAEKPQSSMVWIDVAYSCVRRLNRTDEAHEAIARAERLEISELGKTYLFFVRGMILWREHKLSEAKEQLEKAVIEFRARPRRYLHEGIILLSKAYLCAVNVDLGNADKARSLFRDVESFLIAHREDELLQACRGMAMA